MEELKVQNSLLLQLVKSLQNQINSKNRQNHTLFQQYEQLMAQNQAMQKQLNGQRSQLSEFRRESLSSRHSQASNLSQVDLKIQRQLSELRRRLAQDQTKHQKLRTEFQQKCRLVLDLQNKLQQTMEHAGQIQKQREQINSLKNNVKYIEGKLQVSKKSQLELKSQIDQQKEKIKQLTNNHALIIDNYKLLLTEKDEIMKTLTKEDTQIKAKFEVNQSQYTIEPTPQQGKILQLQSILASKQLALAELTEYLNMQSEKVINLEEEVTKGGSSAQVQQYETKITQLQQIVASKSLSLTELSQFLQSLSVKNREMEEKIESAKIIEQKQQQNQEQKSFQAMTEQLQAITKSKQLQITEFSAHIQELYHQISKMTNEISELKAQKQAVELLQIEKDTLSNKIVSLSDEINLNQKQVEQLKGFLMERNKRINQLEPLQNLIESMRTALSTKQDELAYKQEIIQNKNSELSNLTEVINHQEEELKTKNEEVTALQQKIKCSDEDQYLKQNIKELEESLANKQLTISQLSDFMKDQAQRLEQMEERLSKTESVQNTSQPVHSQVSAAYQKIAELEGILKAKDQSIVDFTLYLQEQLLRMHAMEQQQIKVQSQLADCKQRLQKNQSQLKNDFELLYQEKANECQTRLKDKRQMLNQVEMLMEQKMNEIENIKAQLSQKEQKVRQLQYQNEENKIIKNQLHISIQQMKIRMNLVESQYQQLIQKNECLKLQNQNLQVLAKFKQNDIAQLQSAIQSYQQQIQRCSILSSNYQQQLEYLQQAKIREATIRDEVKCKQHKQGKEGKEGKEVEMDNNEQDEQEKISSLMDVMDDLHEQIRSKHKIIEQMTQQISSLKQNAKSQKHLNQGINIERQNKLKFQLQQKQAQCDMKDQHIQQISSELQIFKNKVIQMEERLTNQNQCHQNDMKKDQFQNMEEIIKNNSGMIEYQQNSQEMTLTQILQKLLFYSQDSENFQLIRYLIEKIKKLQVEKTQQIQKQNNDYKQMLTNFMQSNRKLQAELQRLSREIEENMNIIQQKDSIIQELSKNLKEIEDRFALEVKELRSSMGFFEESPINLGQNLMTSDRNCAKDEELNEVIQHLRQEIQILKKQNRLKEEELSKFHPNLAKEFDDLLGDSCINNEEDKQLVQRLARERDQLKDKCHQYEQKIQCMEKQYMELTESYQNLKHNLKKSHIHNKDQNILSESVRLKQEEIKDLSHQQVQFGSNRNSQNQEQSYHNTLLQQQQPSEYQQMQVNIAEKNEIITELQNTILHIEKGYNTEIMSLRRNIAQLNNQVITLRKSVYQANPNAIDLTEFIKDTFAQNKDTNFFKYELSCKRSPEKYAWPQKNQNQSSYTDHRKDRFVGRANMTYKPYFIEELNLGQRMMGRKCRTPFASTLIHGVDSNSNSFHNGDHSGWESRIHR